jgi:hypothetical protein
MDAAFNDQALITALLTVGADHIMFSSDYPYDMSTDAARWIEQAPIAESDRRKICYGNAAAPAGATLRHDAAEALTDTGISAEVAPGQWFSTYAEPAGVAGIIVPWNAPVALLIRSLAPALAAGNTVAVKMPGQTALVANLVSQIIAEVTSLPRGAVNIFTESGNTGAPCLVASPDVQVISYTGSTIVGRIVAANGAPTLKRMNLELGGKTPMIVFDAADLDAAIPLVASAVTTFAGQFCMTGSRILVQRGVADQVRAGLVSIFENVRLGDGLDPATEMGPLIDKPNVARVEGVVQAALAYAKPVVRGGPATEGDLAAGAFYRPGPCSRSRTSTPTSCRRKSSARSRPSRSSTPRPTPSHAPTPPNMVWRPASSPAASTSAAGSAAGFRPEPSGQTPGRISTTASPKAASGKAASAACAARSPSRTSRKPRPSSTPFRRSRADQPHHA